MQKNHDYEPHWDYSVEDLGDLVTPELKLLIDAAIEAAKTALLSSMEFGGCDVFFVEESSLPGEALAIYCNGTSSWPVLGLDIAAIVDACNGDPIWISEQVKISVAHELAHAYQESCGLDHEDEDGFDEDDAELFAREWYEAGAVNLWLLDPEAMGVDSVDGFPLKTRPHVFHVGSLDARQKGATHNRTSLEGNGLSVSMHPREWTKIAKLSGGKTWELSHPERPVTFLDFHALSDEQKGRISQWALDQGLLRATKSVRITWNDDELGGEIFSDFDISTPHGLKNAQEEFGGYEDGDAQWTELDAVAPTDAMNARIGFRVGVQSALGMAATCYVEDALSDVVDGVWWNDELDPSRYSAPRGVISKRSWGAGWTAVNLDAGEDFAKNPPREFLRKDLNREC